ncbi:hypothetical protein EIP86_005735 [Pleurotus ostreatoroseus]|nr:hypothetical protein EIP86_005735 [Pleurotus ostreatoroseus]
MAQSSPTSSSGRLTPSQRSVQGRIARPPPPEKRESVLRASILDTALELGIGTNSTVANWIFNPVTEGEEDLESPSLTYASTATSEDGLSPARLGLSKSPAGDYDASRLQKDGAFPHQRTVQFDLSPSPVPEPIFEEPSPPGKQWHRKLRKPKPKGDGNGYESDGGYVSEGGKGEKEGKKSKKKTKEKDKKGNMTDQEDDSDGGYFSDILSRRRGKKAKAAAAAARAAKIVDANAVSQMTSYDTDGGPASVPISRNKKDKKSKSAVTSPGMGDESDAGNMSESSAKKKRFFRLRRRAESDTSGGEKSVVPPVPALPTLPPMPPMPLPIADRFVRSDTPLGSILTVDSSASIPYSTSSSASAAASVATLRTETPAGDTARDDASFMDTFTINSSNSSGDGTSLKSPRGLTRAFRDAESIRTPSTDVLRAFGRQVGLSALASPSSSADRSLSASQSQSLAQMQMQMKTVVGLSAVGPPSRDDTHHMASASDPFITLSMLHGVPTPEAQLPRPKRNPSVKRTPAPIQMKISAPNTRALTAKPHPPPLTFTPPSPGSNGGEGASESAQDGNMGFELSPRSPNPRTGSVAFSVVARPTTPSGSVYESLPQSPSGTFTSDVTGASPLPSPNAPNFYTHSANGSQASLPRPRQHFANYDLPPPSPPPMGPLPRLPPTSTPFPSDGQAESPVIAKKSSIRSLKVSTSSRPSMDNYGRPLPSPSPLSKSSSESGVSRPDTAPVSSQAFRAPALKSSASVPPSSAPATIRWQSNPATPSSSGSTTPLFLQRVPSIQRGRESPFPTKPVLFRTETDIFTGGKAPSSTASSPNPRVQTYSQAEAGSEPYSARPGDKGPRQLAVHWQSRSASATGYRRDQEQEQLDAYEDEDEMERHSWVDFGSSNGHEDDRREASGSGSNRSSSSSHPDIESVLSALQDADDSRLYADHSGDDGDEDDRSHYADEGGRATQYFDADGDSDTEGHERYSMWSEEGGGDRRSHASVLDAKRSGDVRAKLTQRVEEMYSRDGIARGLVPPVPALPPNSRRGLQR